MPRTDLEHTVRIPFKIVDGTLKYFYGGELPELKEGSIGDLVVPPWAFADDADRARLEQESVEPLVPAKTMLLVRMRSAIPQSSRPGCQVDPPTSPLSVGVFVEVIVAKDLFLRLRGSKPATLEPVDCIIPALGGAAAKSLNHAYRLICEVFEPTRRSHAGNVFHEAFVWGGKAWIELDVLRSSVEAKYEDRLWPSPKSDDSRP